MAFNDNVLRLNPDGTCTAGPLAKYPTVTSPSGSITVTPITNATTGETEYQVDAVNTATTYSFTEVNGQDGDGIIAIQIVGTDSNGVEILNTTFTMGETETNGVHLSDQYAFDVNTGVLTIETVNDLDESAATPLVLNLETWLQNQIIGAGATNTTWDGDQFIISSEDDTNTLVDNGDGTFTWTPVDNDGAANGTPVTFSSVDDECAEYNQAPNDFDSFVIHGCDSSGKASATICELLASITVTTDIIGG